MARESLSLRQAAIDLQELKGQKPTIREIRDLLKAKGHIQSDPDAIDQWELERARGLLQAVRRFENREGTGKVEMISLFEHLDDGTRREYWRFVSECTIDEAVQHLDYWNRQGRTADRNFHYFLREFSRTLGKKKIQRMLKYDLPEDPQIKEGWG